MASICCFGFWCLLCFCALTSWRCYHSWLQLGKNESCMPHHYRPKTLHFSKIKMAPYHASRSWLWQQVSIIRRFCLALARRLLPLALPRLHTIICISLFVFLLVCLFVFLAPRGALWHQQSIKKQNSCFCGKGYNEHEEMD